MLCRLHTVYKIIHCVTLHTLSDITQWVSTYYTVNCQFFLFNLEIITPGRKKFTQAPPVVPVTNMRYVCNSYARWFTIFWSTNFTDI